MNESSTRNFDKKTRSNRVNQYNSISTSGRGSRVFKEGIIRFGSQKKEKAPPSSKRNLAGSVALGGSSSFINTSNPDFHVRQVSIIDQHEGQPVLSGEFVADEN